MQNAKRFKSTSSIPHVTEEDIPNVTDKSNTTRAKLLRTAFAGAVQIFLGMHFSQVGPALLDLQEISGTDVEGASTYITSIALGYMTGCLMAGFLYDRLSNKVMLVCVPMTLASVCIALIPWCTSYLAMLGTFFIIAISTGNPDTAVMADVLWMWEGQSDAATQFLSFAYSLGGVLGPLYTEPFLAPIRNASDKVPSRDLISVFKNSTEVMRPTTISTNTSQFQLTRNTNTSSLDLHEEESVLFYAFLITGVVGICISIPYYALWVKNCFRRDEMVQKDKKEMETNSMTAQKRLTLKAYVFLTLVFSIFCFLFTMSEESFNVFLPMFLVSHLSWTKAHGALLSSLYWGIGTLTKLSLVFVSRRIDITKILLVSCIGMAISLAAFFISAYFHVQVLVWISTSCFAMSQASVYGGMFTWADSKLLEMDGKATSVAMIFISLGSMAGSLIIGIMMDRISLMAFPYIVLALSLVLLVQFVLVSFILQPFVCRRYGPTRAVEIVIDADEKESFVSTEYADIASVLNGEREMNLLSSKETIKI